MFLYPLESGLALMYGSGVLLGLLESGVDPLPGLSEPLSTLPLLDPPLTLPLLLEGPSKISYPYLKQFCTELQLKLIWACGLQKLTVDNIW